jgi:3-dehydroquinate dehydratase / shikimate dehydrogenase
MLPRLALHIGYRMIEALLFDLWRLKGRVEVGIARILAARAVDTKTAGSHRFAPGIYGSSVFGKDRLCAVVAARAAAEAIRQLKVAPSASKAAQVIELRLDFLSSRAGIGRLLGWVARQPKTPILIATCRRLQAGGRFKGSVDEEITVLKRAVEAGCRWCDVEIETAERIASGQLKKELAPARVLVSAHDFRRLPQNLPALVARLEACGGDAIKIAAACRSLADASRLFELARGRADLVAIPMGDEMLAARVLALRQGSALAYAPVSQSTAPGQIPFDEIERVYRLKRRFGEATGIHRQTSVYGVVADPVGHSLSPLMHNAGFAARHKDAVYLPFRVGNLSDFIAAIRPLGIAGFSVTIPHKERILRYLDDCDPLAAEIGAVNTVVVRGGKLCGYNTDFIGVLRAMERCLPLASSRVLLLGAGGAARAAAFALARAGAAVSIWARRPQRAHALAHAMGGKAIDGVELERESFDAVVNCTPVGMHPRGGSLLRSRELNCRLVMDLIYRPRKTELLRRAERRGIETISGVDMFLAQGIAQWELWMGEPAPELAMRRVVLAALQNEEKSPRR